MSAPRIPRGDRPWDDPLWQALSHFDENRARYPVAELARDMGMLVAWRPDGTAIRDADRDFVTLCNRLTSQGEDPSAFVYEDILLL